MFLSERDNFDLQRPSRGGPAGPTGTEGAYRRGQPRRLFFKGQAAGMGVIIAFAVVAGLIWSAVLLKYGDLITGCLAVLLVGSVFGHAFFHVSVVTADRLLIAWLVAAAVVFRRLGQTTARPLDKADCCFGLFLVVLTLSTLSHDWRLDGAQPLATLLFFYLLPSALYWVARQARLDERSFWLACGFFTLFGVYLAVTAVAEWQRAWSWVFPRFIASPAYEEFLGRARGPFLNPVGCGLYLSMGLFCAAQALPHVHRVGKVALLLVMAGLLAGIYCTLTRSVWLGAGLGLLLMAGLAAPRGWRWALCAALLLGGIPLAAWKASSLQAFKRDRHVSVEQMTQSAKLRPILAAVAWKMFLDRPLWGCGFGQYKEVDADYLHETVGELSLRPARPYVQHNVFLALLTETGLVGLVLWLTTLGLWARRCCDLWRHRGLPLWMRQQALVFLALLAAYACNGMFHDVGIIVMVNSLLFFMAGVSQAIPVQRALPWPLTNPWLLPEVKASVPAATRSPA